MSWPGVKLAECQLLLLLAFFRRIGKVDHQTVEDLLHFIGAEFALQQVFHKFGLSRLPES